MNGDLAELDTDAGEEDNLDPMDINSAAEAFLQLPKHEILEIFLPKESLGKDERGAGHAKQQDKEDNT